MVQALLDGRKTQTRRLLSLRGYREFSEFGPSDTAGYDWHFRREDGCWCDISSDRLKEIVPYAIGDRLYVREAFGIWPIQDSDRREDSIIYRATDDDWECRMFAWRPSIHMPRWASRITLTVTDVRVQRLQDISEEDAKAEGIVQYGRFFGLPDSDWDDAELSAKAAFQNLWDSLNAKRAPWDSNPWVVAVSFDVKKGNIDA